MWKKVGGKHKRTKKCFDRQTDRQTYVCACVHLYVWFFVVFFFITPLSFWPIFHCTIERIVSHECTFETMICRFRHGFRHFVAPPQTSKSRCKQCVCLLVVSFCIHFHFSFCFHVNILLWAWVCGAKVIQSVNKWKYCCARFKCVNLACSKIWMCKNSCKIFNKSRQIFECVV